MTSPAPIKKRITVQIPENAHALLHEAMGLTGMTMSEFVAYAVQEMAERVKREEGPIVFSEEASRKLFEMMENPPPKNERLLAAEARYRELMGKDSPKS